VGTCVTAERALAPELEYTIIYDESKKRAKYNAIDASEPKQK
jgi:hypothetical protein